MRTDRGCVTTDKNWGELCEEGLRPPPDTLSCVEVTWFAEGLIVHPLLFLPAFYLLWRGPWVTSIVDR